MPALDQNEFCYVHVHEYKQENWVWYPACEQRKESLKMMKTNKLMQAGITGSLHKWAGNFLTKRSQQVVLEGISFSSIQVTSGVPQGTVLGPLLFILYLNDLPDGITSQVRLLADDYFIS